MTETSDSLATAAAEHVRATSARWSARPLVTPGRVAVEMSHPVSAGLQFVFREDVAAAEEMGRFREWLRTNSEVSAVEGLPEDVPHASLLRRLREIAKGHWLTRGACNDLASGLDAAACLTPEEAAWYRGHTGVAAPGRPSP